MSNKKTPVSLLAHAAVFAVSMAASAQAGSLTVQPGATAQIDVGSRDNYTEITVTNATATAGSVQLPVGAATVNVPANGKAEFYDRYGRGPSGGSYVSVTNTGSVPLLITSRYQATYMTQ